MPPNESPNINFSQPQYGRGWNNQRENFPDNIRFPPHKSSQDIKMEEMSSAITSMQRCLEKLMQNNFPEKSQRMADGNEMHSNAPAAWRNYHPANQHFAQEAKNVNNPHFPQ